MIFFFGRELLRTIFSEPLGGLRRALYNKSAQNVRAYASSLGFIISGRERLLTTETGETILHELEVGYALLHRYPKRSYWSFLQRRSGRVGEFPNHYLLFPSKSTTISDDLYDLLIAIAEDSQCVRYGLEIEFKTYALTAYFDEKAGTEFVDKVYDYLTAVSEHSH